MKKNKSSSNGGANYPWRYCTVLFFSILFTIKGLGAQSDPMVELLHPFTEAQRFKTFVPSQPGYLYILESSEGPEKLHWRPLLSKVGTGNVLTFTDPEPMQKQRFY